MAVTNGREAHIDLGKQQLDAIKRIERILMAPCCYTQTIDVHASEIAAKMRADVRSMTLAEKTETEILDFYKTLYGEQILAVPDGILGQLAFAVPAVVTAFATGAVVLLLRRFHARTLAIASKESVADFAVPQTVRDEIRRQTTW